MNRVALASATAAALIAATAGAFIIGSAWQPVARVIGLVTSAAAEIGAPIYYQDPDGKPSYSLMPKTTADEHTP
jgi:membrane fusion protein, copper/silver efflux system